MFSSTLPKVTEGEENTSAFHPSGMLDRDQRTTSFGIDRSRRSFIPSSRTTTHENQNRASSVSKCHLNHQSNFDGTITSLVSESCTNLSQARNSNEIVMCPLAKNQRKFDSNRSRTKFPVILRVIAGILFFTINITFIKAKPLGPMVMDNQEFIEMCNATSLNIQTTNYSTQNLKTEMEEYMKTTNTNDITQWEHFAHDKTNVEELFAGKDPLEVFKNITAKHRNQLLMIRNLLNCHLCHHTNKNYMSHTLFIMGLNDSENNQTIKNLKSINNYNELSIIQIEDANKDLKAVANAEVNCTLTPNIGVVMEIITMKKLEAILKSMTNFFNYVEKTFCRH